jgi:hypothetical protein
MSVVLKRASASDLVYRAPYIMGNTLEYLVFEKHNAEGIWIEVATRGDNDEGT